MPLFPNPDYLTGNVGINTTTPGESLEIGATTSSAGRLKLTSYYATDATGLAEVIRLFFANPANMNGNSGKAAIAWYDANSPTYAKVWVQAHNYLQYFNTYTFAPSAVNTGTSQININAYGYPVDGWQVQFSTSGTLPAPLATSTNYYVKKIDNNDFTVYTDSGLSSQVTLTTQGTGTHTITPNLSYNNNDHQHFSIEVTGTDTQTKSSRLSIPYDKDIIEMGVFGSNFNINGNIFRVVGAAGTNRQIELGNTLSDNLSPDGTEKRWIVEADSTAEGGSNAGSNFEVLAYSDTGGSAVNRLFIRRSAAQIGLSGNVNPGADLDIGIASAGGSTTSARLNRGTTSQFASFVLDTAGTDQWSWQLRNDSTQDSHFRDNVNGRTHIHFYQTNGITQLAQGFAKALVTKTGNYNAANTDHNILVDSTSGVVTITLPTAATLAGQEFTIKDWKGQAATHNITIATTSSQTIDGATTYVLSTNYGRLRVVSDGANWSVIDAPPAPSPLVLGDPRGAIGSGAGATNTCYLNYEKVDVGVVLTNMRCRFQAGGNGHYDLGIYDSTGTNGAAGSLLAHCASSSSALATATGVQTPALIGGNLALAPGRYWFALWVDNGTDTIENMATAGASSMFVEQTGTNAGPLPAAASSIASLANGSFRPVIEGLLLGGWS